MPNLDLDLENERNKEKINKIESELSTFFSALEEKYGIGTKDILEIIKRKDRQIPSSIIKDRRLSALEAIVKYMRENWGMKYSSIAYQLGRDAGAIGITYRNARRKMPGKLSPEKGVSIPIFIFRNRKLSVLENIVSYLRKKGLSLHEIAVAINRDDRTIWTVNNRANEKG